MNWGFTGLLDIIIIVLGLLSLLIGFKKGFMSKMVSLIGIIAIIIFSVFYASQFAGFLKSHNIIYPGIYDNVSSKIIEGLGDKADYTVAEAIQASGFPGFLANWIAGAVGDVSTAEIVASVSEQIAGWIMNVIAFGILFVLCLIVLITLKIIIKVVRNATFVRVVDGILGAVLYLALYLVAITALFALLNIFYYQDWFATPREWLNTDMAMNDPGAFRISKALFERNFFVVIISMFKFW
ncbi:MAG: CvpA family protein [Acholeplasmatales bacterium]|nr:CvpA family protein [Acholeplasmatales bacterium]